MRIRDRILLVLFAVGTIAGFASGFRSLHHLRERHDGFERHVAQLCVDAARAGAGAGAGTTEPK